MSRRPFLAFVLLTTISLCGVSILSGFGLYPVSDAALARCKGETP